MLSSHPDVASGPAKEHCPGRRKVPPTQERALGWARGLPVERRKALLNGCLAFWRYPQALRRLRTELGVAGVKVVQLFRDFPQWQVSHFRWLCRPCLGEDATGCNRAARTPEDFHRFLVSPACGHEHTFVNISLRAQYEAMHEAAGGGGQYRAVDQRALLERPRETLRALHKFLGLREYEYPDVSIPRLQDESDPSPYHLAQSHTSIPLHPTPKAFPQ